MNRVSWNKETVLLYSIQYCKSTGQQIKKQRDYFANKSPYNQSYGFSSSHVWMWELDHKEGWAPKNWCFWTVVLEKTLESLLDSKEIKPVNPKGNQPWIFTGRTNAEAEALILWPSDVKNWLTGKDPDPGKNWRQEEKGMTKDEMVGWHHRLNGHEFEQTLEDGEGQETQVCCSPWGHKESDMTEWLNSSNTKSQPLAEDPHTWPCTPDTWTNLWDWTCKHTVSLWKLTTWRLVRGGLTMLEYLKKQSNHKSKAYNRFTKTKKQRIHT